MKKIFAVLILGVALLSANAAYAYDWFNRYDRNHDGRWDRHEYWAAQNYYSRHHAGYPTAGWGPAWNRYDINHDHYWNRHEAWRYHHW